jgi:hypothetical protein
MKNKNLFWNTKSNSGLDSLENNILNLTDSKSFSEQEMAFDQVQIVSSKIWF